MSPGAAARRGSLFVIAAPSGAGKTSLVKAVLERDPSLRVSVSHTTRKRRANEVARRATTTSSPIDEFQRAASPRGEFLEHAQVFDNYYGTGRAQVEALRNAGPRRDPRDRLAGRAAGPQGAARLPAPSSSCRRRASARDAAAQPQDGQRRGDRAAPAGFDCRYVALRGVRPRGRERRLRIRGRKPPANPARRAGLEARRPGLEPLVADLLG